MINISFVISYITDFPHKLNILIISKNIEKLANDQRGDSDQTATRIIGYNPVSRFDRKVKRTDVENAHDYVRYRDWQTVISD